MTSYANWSQRITDENINNDYKYYCQITDSGVITMSFDGLHNLYTKDKKFILDFLRSVYDNKKLLLIDYKDNNGINSVKIKTIINELKSYCKTLSQLDKTYGGLEDRIEYYTYLRTRQI